MRTLLLLGFVVGGLIVAGAIHVSRSGDEIDVSVDTRRVRTIAGEIVREGEVAWRTAEHPANPTTTR